MIRSAALLLLALAALPAQAGDALQAALQAAKSTWPAAEITARDTATACHGPVTADAPGPVRNGLTQVRVRCEGKPVWVRYLALRVQQQGQVAVLRSTLARGASPASTEIEWRAADLMQQPTDVLTTPAALAQLHAKRELPAGSVLRASQFTASQAIQRGQSVTLVGRADGMEVRAPGTALADARLGARVSVRNQNSRRVVEGIAGENGTVEVSL